MNKQINYWIHGPKACGKTILAKQIVGPEGRVISARNCTESAMLRMARECTRIVIDDYNEKSSPCKSLVTSGFSVVSRANAAKLDGISKDPPLETLVIISEWPPQGPALRRRFHIITVTPPV